MASALWLWSTSPSHAVRRSSGKFSPRPSVMDVWSSLASSSHRSSWARMEWRRGLRSPSRSTYMLWRHWIWTTSRWRGVTWRCRWCHRSSRSKHLPLRKLRSPRRKVRNMKKISSLSLTRLRRQGRVSLSRRSQGVLMGSRSQLLSWGGSWQDLAKYRRWGL